MSVIAVSGTSGFLGRQLCQELAARAHEVRGVSRAQLSSPDLSSGLHGVETFVHLAARAHVLADTSEDPSAEFRASNVVLTQAAALAARQSGVKRFVFVSSAGVLGATSPRDGFREESVPHPHDAYTASKWQAEEWLDCEIAPHMEVAILRPPLIYGPGAKGNLMRLLRLALRGWPLPIGALRAPRSLVAVRNIVDLVCVLASHPGTARGTMLVADRELISVADLYRTMARHAGYRPWLAPVSPALIKAALSVTGRGSDIARLTGPFVLHPQTAQAKLQWTPPYSQQAELRRTALCELQPLDIPPGPVR
jgi:nucleoside-diphosphate-sugar epimerase